MSLRMNAEIFHMYYWRTGASQPSRHNGSFFSLSDGAATDTVMLYVILNKQNLVTIQYYHVHSMGSSSKPPLRKAGRAAWLERQTSSRFINRGGPTAATMEGPCSPETASCF